MIKELVGIQERVEARKYASTIKRSSSSPRSDCAIGGDYHTEQQSESKSKFTQSVAKI